jgi:hypothetical protein
MAAEQPLRSLLHFACPTVVDANGRRVPDSLPTMPSQALVARPPANWSALDGVSTMTGGPRCTRWPAVGSFTTAPRKRHHEAAAPGGGLLHQPRPVPSLTARPHGGAARLTSAGGRRPQRGGACTGASGPDLEERRQRQASQYLGAIPQPRPQVRHRQGPCASSTPTRPRSCRADRSSREVPQFQQGCRPEKARRGHHWSIPPAGQPVPEGQEGRAICSTRTRRPCCHWTTRI